MTVALYLFTTNHHFPSLPQPAAQPATLSAVHQISTPFLKQLQSAKSGISFPPSPHPSSSSDLFSTNTRRAAAYPRDCITISCRRTVRAVR
ncbi:hypothetical protein BOTBODRAFT_339575 [Botryobasidium botryosum FD-172 SS1]|uniref:Uncharacterized protein n=1 Tax=Botryobasidium botryosum (strain FD-172 SS1) TaxID=930990 RepID=A0A067MSB8_BOTB1|nr:hypothetical protein BOTBODRAFT_339575 [Botryobasidium botryosum FD-172 SS1]